MWRFAVRCGALLPTTVKTRISMATSPTRIRLAAPALSVLLLKQEQPAWLPRLSLLAALGFTSAMVSDYGADFCLLRG